MKTKNILTMLAVMYGANDMKTRGVLFDDCDAKAFWNDNAAYLATLGRLLK